MLHFIQNNFVQIEMNKKYFNKRRNRIMVQKAFIGRERELQALESVYKKPGFQMAVVYGRRRVGKSTLLAKFIADKKAIFYTATKVGAERNRILLGKQVISALAGNVGNVMFPTMEDLLSFVGNHLPEEKLVFVIDELPYLVEKDEGLLSVFQKFIDHEWREANLFLIFCGSALSFMQNKVLSEKSPVFGRRSMQLELLPFSYLEAAHFVPEYSLEEKAIVYGITGGIGQYLSLIDTSKSLDENIAELFFEKTGYLYEETRNFLTQEFEDVSMANAVIEKLASGENTVNLISDKIHEKPQTVLYTLEKLMSVGLVEKKHCITEEKNRKKTRYVLKDTMFRFWYAFVPEAVSLIELGNGEVYYERIVKPRLHSFMGSVFEDMCRFFTLQKGAQGDFHCFITQTGTWWGMEEVRDAYGSKTYVTADVDVVGLAPLEKAMVVGECKFKGEKLDKAVYETLVRRSRVIPSGYATVRFLLFSLGGFSEWFEKEKPDMVNLYTLEDLYGV